MSAGKFRIGIINGPNLNLLGDREPDLYGNTDFDTFLRFLRNKYPQVEISYFQSNVEGEIVNAIQDSAARQDGLLLNAAAYTHTSVAIADAVQAIHIPVLEIHISNIWNREGFRQKSYIAPYAAGHITGLGLAGYELGILYFINKLL